jgi:divalent metal cation (Fe/Co/Zn/Cd) transporter
MQEGFEPKIAVKTATFATELRLKPLTEPLDETERSDRLKSFVFRKPVALNVRLIRQALLLSSLSIFASLTEAFAGTYFGSGERSIALFGFGLDAVVETGSALIVFWRFWVLRNGRVESYAHRIHRERNATRIIGILLSLLGISIAAKSISDLVSHSIPSSGQAGLWIASGSLLVMSSLWFAKARLASRLDSAALLKDAGCSWVCARLSMLVLLSSAVILLWPRLGWADGTAGFLLAVLVFQEGWRAVRAANRPDFRGGCGCVHG